MGNLLSSLFRLWPGAQGCQKLSVESETLRFSRRAFRAARVGDVGTLRQLQQERDWGWPGAVPLCDIVDSRTELTLLHVAMEKPGSGAECVVHLIEAGCQLTKGDQSLETPLHKACMSDNLEGLKAALQASRGLGVNMEVRDRWRRTLLLKAMVYKSQRVLAFLLELPVNLNAKDVYGLSVAHLAVSYLRLDVLRILAARGANLNLVNMKERSPLTQAIASRNVDMVRELLTLGARTANPLFTAPVVRAVGELIRCFKGGEEYSRAEQVLHLMLAAHGHPLHSAEPDVFQRVLYTADVHAFLPLLHKMHVCSDSVFDDVVRLKEMMQQSRAASRDVGSTDVQVPVSLFDLARRSARRALMARGRNVVWAVDRLNVSLPPAVKGLLLLKDCDYKEVTLPANVGV